MGSGLAAILADRIGKRAPRLDADGVVAAVDVEGDIDLAGHARFSIAPRNAARIFRGVAGISSISTPNGVSASLMALSMAAGAPIAPPSPTPFALVMEASLVGFHVMQLDLGNFARGRRQVIGQRAGEDVAFVAVDDLLQQRIADALRDAAMDLAVRDHRIDDAAGILGHEEFLDRDVAGLDVDLDDRHVAGVGKSAGGIVAAGLGQARLDLAVEAMGLIIGLARHRRDRRSSGRCRRPWPRPLRARCRRPTPQAYGSRS